MALVEGGYMYGGLEEMSDKDQQEEIKKLQSKLRDADHAIANLQREKSLEEERHMLMGLQMNKLRRFDRINAAPLDPDTRARLADLRNQLKLERKQAGRSDPNAMPGEKSPTSKKPSKQAPTIQDAFNTAEEQYKAKEATLQELRDELKDTKAKTNWDQAAHGPPSQRDYMAQDNKIKELKAALAQMRDEQEIAKSISQKKTQQIQQLSAQLESLRDVSKQYETKREELKDKQREKADIQEDIKTLQRIAQRKEHLMKDLRTDREKRDPQTLKRLESDKKVLQHEIQKHADARRTNDRTIQAQHRRLLNLEAKLRTMALALRGLGWGSADSDSHQYRPDVPDGEDQVDVRLFEKTQRELEEARRGQETKDGLMLEKDAEVESLEKKVEIHVHKKESMLRRVKLEKKANNADRARIQYEIELNNDDHDRRMKKLEKELS